jgi:hydrogenase maturation protein HypF
VHQILEMLDRELNSPLTSSCGRLFDAVAALTGHWHEVHYEAQAAIELMALTSMKEVDEAEPLVPLDLLDQEDGPRVIPTTRLVAAAARAVADGAEPATISARFHRTLIDLLCHAAVTASEETGLSDVVLAGGVLQNEVLVQGLWTTLPDFDLQPWRSLQLPANDGAVALGQAAVARARLRAGS